MDEERRKLLEAKGYTVGNATEVLMLSEAEAAVVELRLSLMYAVRNLRADRGLSQAAAAKRAGVTQPQIARAEGKGGQESAGLELSFKVLFGLGGTLADLKPVPKWEPGEDQPRTPKGRLLANKAATKSTPTPKARQTPGRRGSKVGA